MYTYLGMAIELNEAYFYMHRTGLQIAPYASTIYCDISAPSFPFKAINKCITYLSDGHTLLVTARHGSPILMKLKKEKENQSVQADIQFTSLYFTG